MNIHDITMIYDELNKYDELRIGESNRQAEIFYRLYKKLRTITDPLKFKGTIEIDTGMYKVEISFVREFYEDSGTLEVTDESPFKFFKTITYQSDVYDAEYGGNSYYTEKVREINFEGFQTENTIYDFHFTGYEFSNIINVILEKIEKGEVLQEINNRIDWMNSRNERLVYEIKNLDDILKRLSDPRDSFLHTCKYCKKRFFKENFDVERNQCFRTACEMEYRDVPKLVYKTYPCGGDTFSD